MSYATVEKKSNLQTVDGAAARRKLQIKEGSEAEEEFSCKDENGRQIQKRISVNPSQVDNAKFCVFSRGGGDEVDEEGEEEENYNVRKEVSSKQS